MAFDWKIEISKMVYIKQTIADLDHENLWTHSFSQVAATENEIIQVEKNIGTPLDSTFKDFLLHANGWKGFYQSVDLFGTLDLLDEEKMRVAISLLDQTSMKSSNVNLECMLPIGATLVDLDVFCLDLRTGNIIWFAGNEIERYPNFIEFFLTMLDYNREEVTDLKKNISK